MFPTVDMILLKDRYLGGTIPPFFIYAVWCIDYNAPSALPSLLLPPC